MCTLDSSGIFSFYHSFARGVAFSDNITNNLITAAPSLAGAGNRRLLPPATEVVELREHSHVLSAVTAAH